MPSSMDSVFGLPWLRYIIDDRCFEVKTMTDENFDDIIDTVKAYANDKVIAVSLSGGLDSMVLMHVLSNHTKAEVVAWHLNYNNRVESADEARFLKKYCETCGIKLVVEEITGMTRMNTKRSTYERESRRIRFDNYRKIIEQHKCDGIHLAHHKGDIVENIFTNVLKNNTHNADLAVLKKHNLIDGVYIFRPFLGITKERLFLYADKFRIPYFKDTTPLWSCRGKMRNEIFPKLHDCFGDQFTQNLLNFDKERSSSNALLWILMKPYLAYITVGNLVTLNVAIGHTNDMPIHFWTMIFDNFCEKMKIKYFSKKSINNFFENKHRSLMFVMSPDCNLLIPGPHGFIQLELLAESDKNTLT